MPDAQEPPARYINVVVLEADRNSRWRPITHLRSKQGSPPHFAYWSEAHDARCPLAHPLLREQSERVRHISETTRMTQIHPPPTNGDYHDQTKHRFRAWPLGRWIMLQQVDPN